ncbi:MAG TPA: nitrous oxide reductase, partial [Gemmatimonadales bacterium]|nr:nitrous oxide reductase [Gemmatimonadales bacterium]
MTTPRFLAPAAAAAALLLTLAGCGKAPATPGVAGDAAQRVYVAPGAKDEFYAFMSGGYSGQVSVYGLPSGRLLKLIPVFSQFGEDGYGYNDE